MVSVAGASHAFKSRPERDGCDGELSASRRGIAHIHVLYASGICFRPAGIQVDLEVACRFEGHLELQVFCRIGGGRCRHAVDA